MDALLKRPCLAREERSGCCLKCGAPPSHAAPLRAPPTQPS